MRECQTKKRKKQRMAKAKHGDTVKVHYTVKLDDGTVFYSTVGRDPVQFRIGTGEVTPLGVEQAVVGMNPGEWKTVKVPADKAYGLHREEMVMVLNRDKFPAHPELEVGQQVQTRQDGGQTVAGKVADISESSVTLDTNHPLAGKDLIYDIQLIEAFVQQLPSGTPNSILPRDDYDHFNDLMSEVIGHTVVDKRRCLMIYQYAKQVSGLSGDVAEVGAYKGGTARLLAKAFEPEAKIIHLFDTFSGMPPPEPGKDLHKEGDFDNTSLEEVKTYLDDCKNVRFYPGLFPDTSKPVENTTFCLVHIDVDIYKSVMDCCKFFYPRLQRGAIMIFDDYGFWGCPGVKMAVDEFFSNTPENPSCLLTCQCIVTRL